MSELVGDSILRLSYEGIYPPGSEGNPVARAMSQHASEAFDRHRPQAILFDLSRLDYVWGDAICELVVRVFRDRRASPRSIPTTVLAYGQTFEALKSLFSVSILNNIGIRLVNDRTEALDYLSKEIDRIGRAG